MSSLKDKYINPLTDFGFKKLFGTEQAALSLENKFQDEGQNEIRKNATGKSKRTRRNETRNGRTKVSLVGE